MNGVLANLKTNLKYSALMVGLIIVLLAIPLTVYLIQRAPGEFEVRTRAGREHATLELATSKNFYNVDDRVRLYVYLDTGDSTNPITGVDTIINYNSDILATDRGRIISGDIFSSYPMFLVDQGQGQIRISGTVSEVGEYFIGRGLFASVEFTAKKEGRAGFAFVWGGESETRDTNIWGLVNGERWEQLKTRPGSLMITVD